MSVGTVWSSDTRSLFCEGGSWRPCSLPSGPLLSLGPPSEIATQVEGCFLRVGEQGEVTVAWAPILPRACFC